MCEFLLEELLCECPTEKILETYGAEARTVPPAPSGRHALATGEPGLRGGPVPPLGPPPAVSAPGSAFRSPAKSLCSRESPRLPCSLRSLQAGRPCPGSGASSPSRGSPCSYVCVILVDVSFLVRLQTHQFAPGEAGEEGGATRCPPPDQGAVCRRGGKGPLLPGAADRGGVPRLRSGPVSGRRCPASARFPVAAPGRSVRAAGPAGGRRRTVTHSPRAHGAGPDVTLYRWFRFRLGGACGTAGTRSGARGTSGVTRPPSLG